MSLPVWCLPRRAARQAIERCHGVPYISELSRREHHGMILLEGDGAVARDDIGGALHWHTRPMTLTGWLREHKPLAIAAVLLALATLAALT